MFSKTTEYALRATIFIAKNSSVNKKLSLTEISKAIDSPKHFTAKVLQQLTKDNLLISSSTGPRGGFYLSKEAKSQPVSKVLELMGEDVKLTKCVLGLSQCSDNHPCPLHNKYKYIKKELIELFQKESIQDLAQDVQNGNSNIKGEVAEVS